MKKFLPFFLIAFSCIKQTHETKYPSSFEFQIIRTFHRPLIFKYDSTHNLLNVSIYSGHGGYDWGKIESENQIQLSRKQTDTLSKLFDSLNFDALKKQGGILGCDGSKWKMKIGTAEAFSIWTPTAGSEKRNLEALVVLGRYLWKIGNIKEPEKDLDCAPSVELIF